MSHKAYYLLSVLFLAAFQNVPAPFFSAWVECVQRGPYEGMAQAHIGYEFGGEFAVTPEDSRLLGDTATGETIIMPYPLEPGEHLKAMVINVGANKAVLWKVIVFDNLYIVSIWDNPELPDCPIELTPEATPEMTGNV